MIVHIYETAVELVYDNGAVERFDVPQLEVVDHRNEVSLQIDDGYIGFGSEF